MADESFVGNESLKSPELQRLEDEVKQMEAEMDAAFKHFQIDSNYTSAENECDIGIDMSEVQTMSTANNENNGLTLTMNAANNEHYEQTPHERLSPVLPLVQEPPTAAPGMNDYNQTLTLYHFVDALKTLGYLLASIPRGLCHSLVIFVFSLIVQMYPTAPQSGCYISLLLALFHAKPVSWRDKGKLRLVSLVAIVFITIIFDIDWLISNYFVESLGGDDFEYKLTQQTSFVWQMAWWAVAINLFVYLMAIADYLNVWSLLRGYFVSKQKDIPKSVSQKVILLTWVELLSSLLILIYFFLIQSGAISGRMNIFNEALVQILSVQSQHCYSKERAASLCFYHWCIISRLEISVDNADAATFAWWIVVKLAEIRRR